MAYDNQEKSGYDRTKDVEIWKGSVKSEKRYINVQVASYDNHPAAIRLRPCAKNTNPEQKDPKKQWINVPGINGITKDEATQLIKCLQDAIKEF